MSKQELSMLPGNVVEGRTPRISILCPVMNVEKYIGETIQSVLSQSYKDWEMIIMDGASKDNTLEIIRSYADKYPNIRVYSEPDEGSWHAFDKMFDLARGEFICNLCGQDGFLDRDWLKACMDVLERDSQVSLVWGLARELSPEGKLSVDTHISYSHFVTKQGKLDGVKNLVWKIYDVIKNLMFKPDRRKHLFQKLFSRGSLLNVNLLMNRGFVDGKVPQKQDWFSYWLKTGLVFPDQSMVVSRRVWLECIPRYVVGHRTVGYMTDFYYNFNARGYLAYYLPVYATFGRIHPGQSGERAGAELHKQATEYLSRVNTLRKQLARTGKLVTFLNRAGEPVETRTI